MGEVTPLVDQDKLRKALKVEARKVWGRKVRDRRKLLRMTQVHVAALAGTTPQTVFKVERGEIVARDNLRIALAFALGCEVHDLFPMPSRDTILKDVA